MTTTEARGDTGALDSAEVVRLGIVAGAATCVVYPVLAATDLPNVPAAIMAAAIGPLLGVASWGLREFLTLDRRSASSDLGAAGNTIAGAFLTAMILVQVAVKDANEHPGDELKAIWLGLDVAWDAYVGLGTVLFAIAALHHPRLGWPFGLSGLSIGGLLLILNLATFPTPPASAGLVDVGPLVGLWYLAVVIAMLRSLGWVHARVTARRAPFAGP